MLPTQEFCLTRTIENTADRLRAEAVWHEDVDDPGDASLIEVRLIRDGENVRVIIADPESKDDSQIAVLRRKN